MPYPGIDAGPIHRVVQVGVDGQPIYASGTPLVILSTPQTFTANNTTATTPLFGVVGVVEVLRIWAIVTVVIGSNHTASAYRLNDQSAQVDITLATGSTASNFPVGSILRKNATNASAIGTKSSAAGGISDASVTNFAPSVLVQKNGAITNIEYVYTTTNAPTSGAVVHYVEYRPLSVNGSITVL